MSDAKVHTRPTATAAMQLPPANTTPLKRSAWCARLSRSECRLLDSLVGRKDIFALVLTRTRVDVGSWLRKRPVWACLLADEMILFAGGKRAYAQRAALAGLRRSRYNHVTGEVVLAPAEGAQVDSLKMPPFEGLLLLAQIYNEVNDHA